MELLSWFGSSVTLLALIVTILGYLFGRKADSARYDKAPPEKIDFDKIEKEDDPLRELLKKRIQEAQESLKFQNNSEKTNTWATNSLVIGQYIVGGLLASSFIQNTLTKDLIGFLGLLVLASALIHQRFRPDLRAQGSKQRAFRLRSLIRDVEIDLAALKAGANDAPQLIDIIKKVSIILEKIEKSEQDDFATLVEAAGASSKKANK